MNKSKKIISCLGSYAGLILRKKKIYEFITEWNFAAESITLPLRNGYDYDFTVDWGDGSPIGIVTSYDDPDATHEYTQAGTYEIKIKGLCETFYINNGALKTKLIKIIQWGNVGFTSFENSFYGCSNLINLPVNPIDDSVGIISFSGTFYDCISLTSIPAKLFSFCTTASFFDNCFKNCQSLTYIPVGIFDNCTKMDSCMYCFSGCSSITAIPSGLFDNCTVVYFFNDCFSGCSSITAIPSGLFDNCTEVISFSKCFYNDQALTGNAPELWLREPEPTGTQCFYNCTGLDNYDDIPVNWK